MKKYNIIFSVILISCYVSCNPYAGIQANNHPKPFQFILIDSVKGSKSELYIKASEWMAKTFISSKSVTQMSDKDAGKIIGKATFEVRLQDVVLSYTDYVNYTISIDVKDGKYRCVLSDFYHEGGYTTKGKTPSYGSLEKESIKEMGFNMTGKLNDIKNQAAEKSLVVLKDLKHAMSINKADF